MGVRNTGEGARETGSRPGSVANCSDYDTGLVSSLCVTAARSTQGILLQRPLMPLIWINREEGPSPLIAV